MVEELLDLEGRTADIRSGLGEGLACLAVADIRSDLGEGLTCLAVADNLGVLVDLACLELAGKAGSLDTDLVDLVD